MEEDTISCPQKGEDGQVCQFRLKSRFKFCPDCGSKVEKAWFEEGEYKHRFYIAFYSTRPN